MNQALFLHYPAWITKIYDIFLKLILNFSIQFRSFGNISLICNCSTSLNSATNQLLRNRHPRNNLGITNQTKRSD